MPQILIFHINLFPIFVFKWRLGKGAGQEAKQPGADAAAGNLVKLAGKYLLLDAGWITGRGFPSGFQVHGEEFAVFLGHRLRE